MRQQEKLARGMAYCPNTEVHGAENIQDGIRDPREVCISSIMRSNYQVTIRYSGRGIPCISPDAFLIGSYSTGILAEFSAGQLQITMRWRFSATTTDDETHEKLESVFRDGVCPVNIHPSVHRYIDSPRVG